MIFGDFVGLRFFLEAGVAGGEGEAPPPRLRDPSQSRICLSTSARTAGGNSASVAGSTSAPSMPAKLGEAGGGAGGAGRFFFFGDGLNSAVIGTGAGPLSKWPAARDRCATRGLPCSRDQPSSAVATASTSALIRPYASSGTSTLSDETPPQMRLTSAAASSGGDGRGAGNGTDRDFEPPSV